MRIKTYEELIQDYREEELLQDYQKACDCKNDLWVSVDDVIEYFKDVKRDTEGCIILFLEELKAQEVTK